MSLRPRRSLLFMPASNARALEKAKTLPADVLIFDLEDAVAPAAKEQARLAATAAIADDYGTRGKVVRINALSTPWGEDDLTAVSVARPDAILIPKVETIEEISAIRAISGTIPLWCNIETPKGVLNAASIAAAHYDSIAALVAGTNDLSRDLHVTYSSGRDALLYSLSSIVLAARAYGLQVFDGTFTTLTDLAGLEAECKQGKVLGFDGKTIIHPDQINITNQIFSPSKAEITNAYGIINAFDAAQAENKEVCSYNGRMIERLHYEAAKQLVALAQNS